MDFSVLLYILLATVLHECESIEDGSSYIDLKPPYILHQNLGHDDSKEDFNNYKNFELSERMDLRNPSMPFYLFKEENGELLDLLSPPINNLLKSNQYLKNQLIMNLIGLKPKNENHKLQNFATSNLAIKRTLNTSKDRKEYLYHELHPTKNNKSNFQISTSKNQQVSLPRKRGTCCTVGVGSKGKCFPCERAHTDVMYEDLREYASLPLTIVNLTNSLDKDEEICSNIDSKLFETNLKKFPRIIPNWLLKVHTLGACPFSLRKRYLGPNSLPSVIVEVQCHCKGSVCSKYGGDFRCTAVEYPIQTLVKNDQSENFGYDIEFVTSACVCAQIPSANAIDGNQYFVADSEYSNK